MTRRILICDDDTRRAERLANLVKDLVASLGEVSEHFDITALDVTEFAQAARGLYTRRARSRPRREPDHEDQPTGQRSEDLDAEETATGTPPGVATAAASAAQPAEAADPWEAELARIDAADILVLDFDLTPFEHDHHGAQAPPEAAYLAGGSGEMMAYLARCYSTCKYIVVFNQDVLDRTFHLTMQHFVGSYAELNVFGRDLERPGLWIGHDRDQLWRPSHWPKLIDAAKLFEHRVQAVRDASLDASVLDTLGFDQSDVDRLDPRQIDALTEEEDLLDPAGDDGFPDLAGITFRNLLTNRRLGLDPKDHQPDPEQQVRIAAAAVGRWLDQLVLPAQNVLIDAPHLRHFYPAFGGESGAEPAAPDATEFDRIPYAARDLRRPAASWIGHWTCSAAHARQTAFAIDPPSPREDLVFCEDTSRFAPRGEAKEFESDVPGPYSQRFVADLRSEIIYTPVTRLH